MKEDQKSEIKKLHRSCPVCSGKYGAALHRIAMLLPDDVPIPGEYDVVCCSDCGFTFADADGSQKMYDAYYKNNNDYSCSALLKTGITESMNKARYQLLGRYVARDARILDVGCGSGSLLKLLKEKGYKNLYGLDPSRDSIEGLRAQGIRGEVKNIFDEIADEHKHSFDVVMSTAVIEHIYDINRFLEQLLGYLVPANGRIYIDAPAVEGFGQIYRSRANYFNQEHINYFSLTSLDNMLAKYGCERKSLEAESVVMVHEEQPEMSITAVYAHTGQKAGWKKDTVSKRSIKDYFVQDREKEQADAQKIQRFIRDSGLRILIWGTGAYTMQLLCSMPQIHERIAGFIDSNVMKTGRRILGKEVYAPQRLLHDAMPYPILICSMLNAGDIEKQIQAMGIANRYLSVADS